MIPQEPKCNPAKMLAIMALAKLPESLTSGLFNLDDIVKGQVKKFL